MGSTNPWWTVFAVYDDNDQAFVHFIQAKDCAGARSKALREADGVILIAGIVPGKVQPVDETSGVIPIRGRGHAIDVTAVYVTTKQIVVPGRCPGCKTDTRRANALIETNFVSRRWNAHLSHNGKDISAERGGRSIDGSKMIETTHLQCSGCSYVIWDGVTYG